MNDQIHFSGTYVEGGHGIIDYEFRWLVKSGEVPNSTIREIASELLLMHEGDDGEGEAEDV